MGVAATDGDMDRILKLGSSRLVLVNRMQPNRASNNWCVFFIVV